MRLTGSTGDVTDLDVKQRKDQRYLANVALTVSIWRSLSMVLRWDVLVSRSNMARSSEPPGPECFQPGSTCSALDFDDKNYTKQVLTLELGYTF